MATSRKDAILDAVVAVVAERGVRGASVELVIARARVSRRTFYELFSGIEDCLVAVLDRGLARARPLIVRGFEGEGSWRDGMRAALAGMLAFCDSEIELVRVCLVETLAAGRVVREHRECVAEEFRELVVDRIGGEVSHPPWLASEGVLASVLGIAIARLSAREPQPLLALLGPLMGLILAPYLDEAELAREIERGNELARELLDARVRTAGSEAAAVTVPPALRDPRAHRLRLCLRYVAEHPGVSNSEVGEGIGVSHRGQLAALLGQLSELGLASKQAGGPGRPNAWWLTVAGQLVAQALEDQR
jgi:AcrR family transcriptional regulator